MTTYRELMIAAGYSGLGMQEAVEMYEAQGLNLDTQALCEVCGKHAVKVDEELEIFTCGEHEEAAK